MAQETSFPAVIIISRGPTPEHNDVMVCADDRVCRDDRELRQRLAVLDAWRKAYRAPYYTHTPTPAGEVQAAIVKMRAELEAQHGLASAGLAPASDHLAEAYEAAKLAFDGEPENLDRLERALALVKAGAVVALGGGQWQVASQTGNGAYLINGSCGCPDAVYRGATWCKHRLAVALVRKADLLANEAKGAATPKASEAPEGTPQPQDSTTPDLAQMRAIGRTWGGPGVALERFDGSREERRDLDYPQLEAQAKAAGWIPIGKQGRLENPAYDWQAEEDRLQREWTRKLAARSSEQVAAQRARA